MELLQNALSGFQVAFEPANLLYVFIGVFVGTVVGVLPGLGPAATIALLLPLTYAMSPEAAIILLAGIYYGAFYGGTITSVMLQLPGEAASVVTVIDGHQMARQGRAGPALGIAAIGSFVGGTAAVVGLSLFAPLLASFAVRFGPPEFTALAVLGLLMVSYLGTKSLARSLIIACIGLLLATIGQDPIVGTTRFTFGLGNLLDGLDFVAIAMGLFGLGEILYSLDEGDLQARAAARVSHILPSRSDLNQSKGAIARGSFLGFFIGLLPGGGGAVSSLASYAVEKRLAKDPRRFGRGAIEGVAGPETANNASSTSAFIPLLTLGLPSNVVLALIFGALLLQGITPGPLLIQQNPEVFWGVIASMYIGNAILLVLNIPLVGLFIQILRAPAGILASITVVIVMTGVYTVNNSVFDMWVVLVFGVGGYLMRKVGFEPGPLVLAFVLGPILESSFRQSLLLGNGDPAIFVTRPISAIILALALAIVALAVVEGIGERRQHS